MSEVTLRIATTVSQKDNWLVPPERDLRTLDSPATPPAPDRATLAFDRSHSRPYAKSVIREPHGNRFPCYLSIIGYQGNISLYI